MPIHISQVVEPVSDKDFHLLDYKVMGIIFSIHREFGRFWNEKIYQNELLHRCRKSGIIDVAKEVAIHVSYKNFQKVYFIDLLIENVIYELKVAETFASAHNKQVINYLMLTGLNKAKLVNFGTASVQHRFVTTNITNNDRFDFAIKYERWINANEESYRLKQLMVNLISEWGVFLDINLFYEAVEFFQGGRDQILKNVQIRFKDHVVGYQKIHLISPGIALKISSVKKDTHKYEAHLNRFLQCSPLNAIQWINFNNNYITFRTILKQDIQ